MAADDFFLTTATTPTEAAGVATLHETYRHIDIAFNHAGLMPISDIASLKVAEWHRMVDVNVKGLFNTVAAVLPIMQAQQSGHMINKMEQLKEQMKLLKPEDIADAILYALQAPDHVDVADLFVMPTAQPW